MLAWVSTEFQKQKNQRSEIGKKSDGNELMAEAFSRYLIFRKNSLLTLARNVVKLFKSKPKWRTRNSRKRSSLQRRNTSSGIEQSTDSLKIDQECKKYSHLFSAKAGVSRWYRAGERNFDAFSTEKQTQSKSQFKKGYESIIKSFTSGKYSERVTRKAAKPSQKNQSHQSVRNSPKLTETPPLDESPQMVQNPEKEFEEKEIDSGVTNLFDHLSPVGVELDVH
jgi:hypothetical protein